MGSYRARTASSGNRDSITRDDPVGLRREVMVPVPSYRRPSSLIGLSIVFVLLASAVDAVVWTYQAKRDAETLEREAVPALSHTDAAALRARVERAEMIRALEDQDIRQQLSEALERTWAGPYDDAGHYGKMNQTFDEDGLVPVELCDESDPLCSF